MKSKSVVRRCSSADLSAKEMKAAPEMPNQLAVSAPPERLPSPPRHVITAAAIAGSERAADPVANPATPSAKATETKGRRRTEAAEESDVDEVREVATPDSGDIHDHRYDDERCM